MTPIDHRPYFTLPARVVMTEPEPVVFKKAKA